MRFQLDPKGEAPARPPRVAAPSVVPAPVPAPPASPSPLGASSRKRWWIVLGVVALLLVAGGGLGAYVMKVGPFAYPDRYLLQKGEEPSGTRLSLNAQVREFLGLSQNPGQMSDAKIDDLIARGGDATRPSEVWAEDLATRFIGEDVIVVAIKYASAADAQNEVGSASDGCNHRDLGGGGTVLRDGAVVVVIGALGADASSSVRAVQKALVAKTPSLALACSF